MMQLVPFGGVEEPAEDAGHEWQVAVAYVRSRQPEHEHNAHHLGTGTQEGQRDR
jgi:hypothetical protein